MPNQEIYQLLAYLMTALEANGFRIGTGQQLRLHQLLEQFPAISADSLKTHLAPIFTKNKDEQQLFYELFEEAKKQIALPASETSSPPPKAKNVYRKWIWVFAAIAGILLIVLLWLRLNPPQIQYDYLNKPIPVLSQTVVQGDTVTLQIAAVFRANELLVKTGKNRFQKGNIPQIAYTLCNGLSKSNDVGVGIASVNAFGTLTYIGQDTGKISTCVTMAFELSENVEPIIDTVFVEINVESTLPIDDNAIPVPTKVTSSLNTRALPISRNIEELQMPQIEGWTKTYYTFEKKWQAWFNNHLFISLLLLISVVFYLFYFFKFKKIIQFEKAIIRIPHKINFATYKQQLSELINKDADAAYQQLLSELTPEMKQVLISIKKNSAIANVQLTQKRNTTRKFQDVEQINAENNYSETVETTQNTTNIYDDPFRHFSDFKYDLTNFANELNERHFADNALKAFYTLNFNKILNGIVPIIIATAGSIVFVILLFAFHLKLILSLLLGGLIYVITHYLDDNRKIIAELDTSKKPPFIWNIEIPDTPKVIYNENFYSALNQLRQRTEDQFYRLNVQETVKATIASGGQIAFQYTQQTKQPEYLMLIDRRSAANHRAAMFNMLCEAFRSNDVLIERFYFDGDIRLVFNELQPNGIRLKDLKYQFQDARLLILSDGYSLLDSRTGKLSKWVSVLSSWKDKAIMTPNVAANWGRKERQLAEEFVILPSTVEGFQRVIEEFEAVAPADFSKWQKIQDVSLEKIAFKGDLITTLNYYYLKNDNVNLIKWIAACAVYPTIHWDLTLSIGQLLSKQTNDTELVSLDNLLEINRLSWFIDGKIPKQVRLELVEYLEKNDSVFLKIVREHLHELLQNNPPPKDSAAFEDHQMNIVLNEMMMTDDKARQKELETALKKLLEAGVEPDVTVLKYLDRPQSALDFYVPNSWKAYVFNDGKPFLGRKHWTWAIPTWLFLATFICLYHPTLPECNGEAVDYDQRELCLKRFEDRVLFHEFATLNFIKNQQYEQADSLVRIVNNWFENDVELVTDFTDEPIYHYKKVEKFSMKSISYFQNVATAYYNEGVPFYNEYKQHIQQRTLSEYNPTVNDKIKILKDSSCHFFNMALSLDSTVQIYKDLGAECMTGEVFEGYFLPFLKGKVLDKTTQKPLDKVEITTALGVTAMSDKSGNYVLQLGKRPIFDLNINVSKKGYESLSQTIALEEYLTDLPTIYLEITKKIKPTQPTKTKPTKPTREEDNSNVDKTQHGGVVDNSNSNYPLPQDQQAPVPTSHTMLHIPAMVSVKGGMFQISINKEKNSWYKVSLSNYHIGKYEVTNKEYLDFVREKGVQASKSKITKVWLDKTVSKIVENENTWSIAANYENHPVTGVTWDGAVEYCLWLSEKTGKVYRLPTEAEWQYAAEGGGTAAFDYSGSNQLKDVAWYKDNANNTYTVGRKQPNALGIYDMSGNVWEWCNDWYEKDFWNQLIVAQKEVTVSNPKGPVKGIFKVVRGGSFQEKESKCRVDYRNFYYTNLRAKDRGFRVVME